MRCFKWFDFSGNYGDPAQAITAYHCQLKPPQLSVWSSVVWSTSMWRMEKSLSPGLKGAEMPAERDERGQFKKSTDEQMNAWMIAQIRNKPANRIARRLFDADARARQEANNGD
jgi:hypothetical protein